MEGIIRNAVKILGPPKVVINEMLDLHRFRNPVYDAAVNFSPYDRVSPLIPEWLEFAWKSQGGDLYVPRGVDTDLFSKELSRQWDNIEWTDSRTSNKVEWPEPKLALNAQQNAVISVIKKVRKNGTRPFGNLLILGSTSMGKTITGIELCRRFRQKALVLVPTELILRAWYSDLQKYLGLKPDQVGLIKRAKWKIGEQITLASVQTLHRRRERWPELNEIFGAVVIDEVQGIAAMSLYDFAAQTPARWLIGVTATESSSGGVNLHLRSLLGKPVVDVNVMGEATSSALPISEAKLIKTNFRYVCQTDNLMWDDLCENFAADEDRNALACREILSDWYDRRSILIYTRSLEHQAVLYDMLREIGISDVNLINGTTNTDKQYTASLIRAVNNGKVRTVIGTAAVKVGANIPRFDCLHILTPMASVGNLEQLIGRVRRQAEGKENVVLRYYADFNVKYLESLYRRVAVPVFRKAKIPGYYKNDEAIKNKAGERHFVQV